MFKTFEVEIVRHLSGADLTWPTRGGANADSGLGGNRDYVDLRRVSWTQVKRALPFELALMNSLRGSRDAAEDYEDDQRNEDINEILLGLDVGVASAVMALSASRCVPFSSCSGGAFSRRTHFEEHPLVAFYARLPWLPLLLTVAESAEIGMTNGPSGAVVAFADDVYKFTRFASTLYDRRHKINNLKAPRQQHLDNRREQFSLFLTS
jgi:hypothetical protein